MAGNFGIRSFIRAGQTHLEIIRQPDDPRYPFCGSFRGEVLSA